MSRSDNIKWIYKSIIKHFNDSKGTLFLHIEGQQKVLTSSNADHIELRIDGPFIIPLAGVNEYHYEVNVIVQTLMNKTSIYTHLDNIAKAVILFPDKLNIYKLGGDGSVFGCLKIQHNPYKSRREWIQVTNLGQIEPNNPVLQATIEAKYQIDLED